MSARLSKEQKVVCICRGGQVRSVSARYILADKFGFQKVLACGWEKNDRETVAMLCDWADVVLVLGSHELEPDPVIPADGGKVMFLNIGPDIWGRYNHKNLVETLTPILDRLVAEEVVAS